MNLVTYIVVVGVASWLLTGFLRRYAQKHNLLDIPNQRSSHVLPVPRGGGVAIAVTFIAGIFYLYANNFLNLTVFLAFIGAGSVVSLVGLMDDRYHVSPKWRLIVHFLAVVWGVVWLGNTYENMYNEIFRYTGLYLLVEIIFLVWVLNLFNFMDGIDGIAASEAIFVTGCGFLFATLGGRESQQLVAILFIGAISGFLIWNWPPAKIFMGDAGSGFLGITLGLYAYWTARDDVVTIWTWAIIMGVFLVDATYTLFRRILRKAQWYKAHRSHAYQHAAQRWGHLTVTVTVIFINVFWLLPIAYCSNHFRDLGPEFTLLALMPLVVLAYKLEAGKEA